MPTLHILGAGTPSPARERWGTAFALEFEHDVVMIDCGRAATWKLTQAGLRPVDVSWLLVTHLHSDHFVDYPCLVLTRWDHCVGGEVPLMVMGPAPIRAVTGKLFGPEGAFADDLRARAEHIASKRVHLIRGGTLPRPGLQMMVHDTVTGVMVGGQGWSARCAEVDHMQPYMTTLAWRIDWPGGSVVFSSDTRPCKALVELAAGAHLLVANCPLRQQAMPPEMGTCIFGTLDAAQLARDAGVGRMILTHLTRSIVREREEALAEIAEVFPGEVLIADELMRVEL
ncbi:MAG: MBL fold metallo-hydrolase [Armatimonadota bacterium]